MKILKNTIIKISSAVVLFLVFTLLILFFLSQKKVDQVVEEEAEQVVNLGSGTLVYALSKEPERVTNIYKYDIEKKEESELFPEEKELVKFSPSLSPKKDMVAFSGAPIDFTSKLLFPHTEHLQIYIHDFNSKTTSKITNSTTTFRSKSPKWSEDGRFIMYHGYKSSAWEKNLSIREPNNWEIFVYDRLTSSTEKIDDGIEAVWGKNSASIFYLKNDGLYFYNTSNKKSELLVEVTNKNKDNPVPPKVSGGMTLAVNDSADMLAWASPSTNELVIYTINYNLRPNISVLHRFNTGEAEIYHPVFSPDGKMLAVQESEFPVQRIQVRGEPGNELSLPKLNLEKPRITIYELNSFKAKKIRDLQGYDFFGTSLTQWVK